MSACLLLLFMVMAVLGVPLSISLGLSGAITLWWFDLPLSMISQAMSSSINSFLLIAVPLFILAGQIMERGGLSERIFDAAEALVGRFRGGLGHVNIASSFVFGGISGSSVADIARDVYKRQPIVNACPASCPGKIGQGKLILPAKDNPTMQLCTQWLVCPSPSLRLPHVRHFIEWVEEAANRWHEESLPLFEQT